MSTSEARLLVAEPSVARPPRTTLRDVYRTERAVVCSLLRKLGVREPDVGDLAADVFLTAHRRWDEYDPARPLRPWLLGIAVRVASDARRLARHRREVPDDDATVEPVDDAPLPDDAVESKRAGERLARALANLDPEARALVVEADAFAVPVPETAKALGLNLNTAYARLRRARERLALVTRGEDRRADAPRR